ncbi:MAG TPA: GNAT family N-acetyltransferase [Bradyrhizobium sp.]
MIETPRLRLHQWDDRHRDAFAAMHADPDVMADYGGPIGRAESETKFERYVAAQRDHGISRWAVEDVGGALLGYAGVMPRLNLRRDPARDFTTLTLRGEPWRGLVWVVPAGWSRD